MGSGNSVCLGAQLGVTQADRECIDLTFFFYLRGLGPPTVVAPRAADVGGAGACDGCWDAIGEVVTVWDKWVLGAWAPAFTVSGS
mmetsp:Transcript_75189/g.201551  ORF Transcript_75189/g.201551 Transcript_75189/m.201551 type:complete len:85 (+) Transcript_75189:456-710(+)